MKICQYVCKMRIYSHLLGSTNCLILIFPYFKNRLGLCLQKHWHLYTHLRAHTIKHLPLRSSWLLCPMKFLRLGAAGLHLIRYYVYVYVCMYDYHIAVSIRHWLRLNDDKRLYYLMQGSVGQLNLQLSVSKSTTASTGKSTSLGGVRLRGIMQHSSPSFTHTAGACTCAILLRLWIIRSLQAYAWEGNNCPR